MPHRWATARLRRRQLGHYSYYEWGWYEYKYKYKYRCKCKCKHKHKYKTSATGIILIMRLGRICIFESTRRHSNTNITIFIAIFITIIINSSSNLEGVKSIAVNAAREKCKKSQIILPSHFQTGPFNRTLVIYMVMIGNWQVFWVQFLKVRNSAACVILWTNIIQAHHFWSATTRAALGNLTSLHIIQQPVLAQRWAHITRFLEKRDFFGNLFVVRSEYIFGGVLLLLIVVAIMRQ